MVWIIRSFVCVCEGVLCHGRPFATPQPVAHQAPLPMGFSRQECWSELPFPPLGHLLNIGIKPMSLVFPTREGGFFTNGATGEALHFTVRTF